MKVQVIILIYTHVVLGVLALRVGPSVHYTLTKKSRIIKLANQAYLSEKLERLSCLALYKHIHTRD